MEKADRPALLPEPAQPQAWSRHEAEAAFAEPLVEQLRYGFASRNGGKLAMPERTEEGRYR